MNTISEVKAALVATLAGIVGGTDYANAIPDGHIYDHYSSAIVDNSSDASFPKVIVVLDSGTSESRPAEQFIKTLRFLIFVFVKKLEASHDQVNTTESFIEDVEKAIEQNSGLNGTVNNASVTEFLTDGGVLAPMGCAIITVEALLTSA